MKFDKKKIFGLCGQILFAIFVIIAMYATGFDHYSDDVASQTITLKDFNVDLAPDTMKNIYGLGLAGIVIAFVAIVLPLVSMFVENKKMNMAFGWIMMVLDVTVLAVVVAALGLYVSNTGDSEDKLFGKLNNAGYIAGSFIFTIVGAGLGIAGNAIAYKADLKQA